MKTIRAILFPRESVPLAVHPDHGTGLESASASHDLWRESDRFMRTPEFTQPMKRAQRWVHHKSHATSWELEDY